MPTKKENDIHFKINWHTILLSHTDSEEDMMKKISSVLSFEEVLKNELSEYKVPNEQLVAENNELVKLNTTLNFNIEIQVMMLDRLKTAVWEEEYNKIRKEITSSDLFAKLKDRAWL